MKTMRKQRGLTLIETLITLAILSFGLVALMKLQSYLSSHSSIAKQQAEAVTLAQKKIEELRYFEQINSSTGKIAYNDIVTGNEQINTSTSNYTMSWNIIDQTSPDHKVVAMTITWTDQNGTTQNITLSSIIGKMDPAISGSVMTPVAAGVLQPPS